MKLLVDIYTNILPSVIGVKDTRMLLQYSISFSFPVPASYLAALFLPEDGRWGVSCGAALEGDAPPLGSNLVSGFCSNLRWYCRGKEIQPLIHSITAAYKEARLQHSLSLRVLLHLVSATRFSMTFQALLLQSVTTASFAPSSVILIPCAVFTSGRMWVEHCPARLR